MLQPAVVHLASTRQLAAPLARTPPEAVCPQTLAAGQRSAEARTPALQCLLFGFGRNDHSHSNTEEETSGCAQCVVLSVGRYDHSYIITEEPEPGDRLIQNLHAAITTSKRSPTTLKQSQTDPNLHLQLPFELRALEVVLDEAANLLGVEVRGVVRSAEKRMVRLSDHTVRAVPCSCRARQRLR
jgi:hypothetical protein